MTVEIVTMSGDYGARVNHTIPNDPMWRSFFSLVEVVLPNMVKLGTPLACPEPLSNIEVASIVQLILRRPVTVGAQPVDTIDSVEEKGCPRCWQTFDLT
jgi:hypothetical protein